MCGSYFFLVLETEIDLIVKSSCCVKHLATVHLSCQPGKQIVGWCALTLWHKKYASTTTRFVFGTVTTVHVSLEINCLVHPLAAAVKGRHSGSSVSIFFCPLHFLLPLQPPACPLSHINYILKLWSVLLFVLVIFAVSHSRGDLAVNAVASHLQVYGLDFYLCVYLFFWCSVSLLLKS